jgi:predicted lipoprotein
MKRAAVISCLVLVACGVFWMFPLFHIVRLDAMRAAEQQTAFNARTFVARFWQERILPSLDAAADAEAVLSAMDEDRQAALRKFGRKTGVGRTTLLLLQGTGSIVNVDAKSVGVSLAQDQTKTDVVLRAGLLFGNTVRDATGLLDSSDFENSQQFNDISTELNRHIEVHVIPILRAKSAVGRQVRFVGCAEVPDNAGDVRPLTLIPLVVDIN